MLGGFLIVVVLIGIGFGADAAATVVRGTVVVAAIVLLLIVAVVAVLLARDCNESHRRHAGVNGTRTFMASGVGPRLDARVLTVDGLRREVTVDGSRPRPA